MKKEASSNKKKRLTQREMQEILIENFVGLQKAMTNLSIKFESLSDQTSKLLQIFEISAKNFMKAGGTNPEESKDILDKIDSLLDQNKTIAKGLVLIEEKVRNTNPQENLSIMDRPRPKPLPRI